MRDGGITMTRAQKIRKKRLEESMTANQAKIQHELEVHGKAK